jgi:hypothetical protein
MIIITDLDGTLARVAWRAFMMSDWDAYWEASWQDKPNQPMIDLINMLSKSCRIVCITGRPERWRQLTNSWLMRYGVKVHELWMRPNDDRRPSPQLKIDLMKKMTEQVLLSEIIVAVDDRADVIKAYQEHGLLTLQAQEL